MQQEQQFNQASSLLPLVDQYATSLNLTPERVAQIKANPVGNMAFLQALQTNNMSTAFAKTKASNNNLGSNFLSILSNFITSSPNENIFSSNVLAFWPNGKIKLIKKHDKSLIAGFILDYDNTRLDASVKKRLDKMKKQLKTTN